MPKFKIGDKVKVVYNIKHREKHRHGGDEAVIKKVDIGIYPYIISIDDDYYYGEEELELIQEPKPSWKKMKLIDYKKIAKVGDKINLLIPDHTCECIVDEIKGDKFLILTDNNYFSGYGGKGTYKHCYWWNFSSSEEIELLTDKVFTKKRKAYIEITKETGKIYISLKIPSEIEDFFKVNSEGKVKTSEAWFSKAKGVEYYAQPKELDKKLTEIDSYVYSDFGSGLIREDKINVAMLRAVGASKGIKVHSEGFSGFTNADLQDYVRRLGLYIKTLWESSVSETRIKSVITYEL